jgi:hypothetical protein
MDINQSDHYANHYEQSGYWAGQNPDFFGLSGPVQDEQLHNLFEGFSPDRKTNLLQNAGSLDLQKAPEFVPNPDKHGSPC